MKRVWQAAFIVMLATETLVVGQGTDVAKILGDVRAALGGDQKLAAVKSVSASGRMSRVTGDTSSPPTDVTFAFELPDKYVKTYVAAVLGTTTLTRTSGFNGDGLIENIDRPPALGGQIVFQSTSGGGAPGQTQTPEQIEAARKAGVLANKEEFTRLALGMFATSMSAYPVQFSYVGQAQSLDGTAEVIDVKGEGDFAARLFVDSKTHLPLMLSWMAKEPLVLSSGGPGGSAGPTSGNGVVVSRQAGSSLSPADLAKKQQELADRLKEAEAKRRIVEYRMYYGDYHSVDGVKLPFHIQRSIDGKPVEDVTLEKVKVNAKIDPKTFDVSK